MIKHTFVGDWQHVAGPLLLTALVVVVALGLALS
jgi:hypothetical protein